MLNRRPYNEAVCSPGRHFPPPADGAEMTSRRNARRYSNPITPVRAVLFAVLVAALVGAVSAAAQSTLGEPVPWKNRAGEALPFQSDAEILEFLRTAEITAVEDLEVGITDPRRVEMVKDGITVRAALRDFDETFERMRFEFDFYLELRDSFRFDIAAYELAKFFGLDNIPPVTLRTVNGVEATLQIWLEDALVEWDRFDDKIVPPDLLLFQKQRQNMLVFDSFIGNVDRNNGNILYDENWNHWLIDHSRAFVKRDDRMRYLDEIHWCARRLYEGLRDIDAAQLQELVSPPLGPIEIDFMLRRRDKIIARLDALIDERGVDAVLF